MLERYEVLRTLGSGAFGQVLLAQDRQLGRRVAIKLLTRIDPEASTRERFAREAQATAAVSHPGVVQVFDQGVDEGAAWIVYEFVQGPDLAERMKDPIDRDQALAWGAQGARALGALHQRGVVHRDVKPANVLLRDGVEPVLCDLGLAYVEEDATRLTATGAVMGTPGYMAPELLRGDPSEAASDQFGWAAVVWQMVSGRPLRTVRNFGELIALAVDGAPHELKGQASGAGPEVDAALARALAPYPQDRFPQIEDLAAALEACIEDPDLSGVSRSARWQLVPRPEDAAPPSPGRAAPGPGALREPTPRGPASRAKAAATRRDRPRLAAPGPAPPATRRVGRPAPRPRPRAALPLALVATLLGLSVGWLLRAPAPRAPTPPPPARLQAPPDGLDPALDDLARSLARAQAPWSDEQGALVPDPGDVPRWRRGPQLAGRVMDPRLPMSLRRVVRHLVPAVRALDAASAEDPRRARGLALMAATVAWVAEMQEDLWAYRQALETASFGGAEPELAASLDPADLPRWRELRDELAVAAQNGVADVLRAVPRPPAPVPTLLARLARLDPVLDDDALKQALARRQRGELDPAQLADRLRARVQATGVPAADWATPAAPEGGADDE